jgi:hypothetical protein
VEYSGILGLDVLRSLQAKLDLTGNNMIAVHDHIPFLTVRLQSHCSQGSRKTYAVASNDRPGQSVRCDRDSHIELPVPLSPEFEDCTIPHLSAQDTQEGKSQLGETAREGGAQATLACCTTIPPR